MVLVTGGEIISGPASAELYDPASGAWTVTGNLKTPRLTRRPCYKTAWSLWQEETALYPYPERGTIRPYERDLDRDRQPQHRTFLSHGHVAAQWHGPCCSGT